MKIAVFSTKPYDRRFLEQANEGLGQVWVLWELVGLETVGLVL